MSVASISIKHPLTTILAFITMGVLGIISILSLGRELFPDVTFPTAAVFTVYPGVGPVEVESSVTKLIEDAVSTINGVQQVSSSSAEGISLVTINFNWGRNMDTIVADIREKLNSVESDLPEGAHRPGVVRFNPENLPALILNVYSTTPGVDIRRMVEKEVKSELERITGVASVDIYGGKIAAVTCQLDLDSISKKEISILQILKVFQGENINLPGGSLSLKERFIILRTLGEFRNLDDIGNVLVGYRENVPIFLKDVADISLSFLPQEEFARA
ncbi:MAG: efflux RND transporter permease subunit, partial [Spirochaetota bacterium]